MVSLVASMTGDHPGRAVLVLANDPAAKGLARAADMDVPVCSRWITAVGKDRAAFEAALLKPLLAAEPDVICLGIHADSDAGFHSPVRRAYSEHPPTFAFAEIPRSAHPQRALEAGDAEGGLHRA